VDALREHVTKLLKYRPSAENFPIVISQDCDVKAVREVVKEFGSQVQYVKHLSSETSRVTIPPKHVRFKMYYKISRHYR